MPRKKALSGGGKAYVGFWFHCSPNPGISRNEPVQQSVREAIESALVHMIAQGARDGSWSLKNPDDLNKPLLQSYLKSYDELTQAMPLTGKPE